MISYDALAFSYDGLMEDARYPKRATYIETLLRASRIPVHTVLDLGCGTGTLAYLLAGRGYEVLAVDGSEEMLTRAAGKAASFSGQMPLFLHQQMPRLRLAEPVDAVISTMDSLNYLTRQRELQETLHRVFRWLKPGGLFLFDVNSVEKFRRMDGQLYTDETEDSFCAWRTFFSEKTRLCTYQVDLFRLRADGAWDREFEEHRERAWEEAQLRRFLAEAGFREVTVTGDLRRSAPRPDEDRLIFRCEKPLL